MLWEYSWVTVVPSPCSMDCPTMALPYPAVTVLPVVAKVPLTQSTSIADLG